MMGMSTVDMPNVMTIMRLARCKFGCHLKVYKAPAKVPTAVATGPAKPKMGTKKSSLKMNEETVRKETKRVRDREALTRVCSM